MPINHFLVRRRLQAPEAKILEETLANGGQFLVRPPVGQRWQVLYGSIKWDTVGSGTIALSVRLVVNGTAGVIEQFTTNGSIGAGITLAGTNPMILDNDNYLRFNCTATSGGAVISKRIGESIMTEVNKTGFIKAIDDFFTSAKKTTDIGRGIENLALRKASETLGFAAESAIEAGNLTLAQEINDQHLAMLESKEIRELGTDPINARFFDAQRARILSTGETIKSPPKEFPDLATRIQEAEEIAKAKSAAGGFKTAEEQIELSRKKGKASKEGFLSVDKPRLTNAEFFAKFGEPKSTKSRPGPGKEDPAELARLAEIDKILQANLDASPNRLLGLLGSDAEKARFSFDPVAKEKEKRALRLKIAKRNKGK